jgi:hypothetical protein
MSAISRADLETLIDAFENGRLEKSCWHHREHLMMATWYLDRLGEEQGIAKIREGILNFARVHGIAQTKDAGYHETVTVFLARAIAQELRSFDAKAPIERKAEHIVATFHDAKRLLLQHYTRDRLNSWEARTGWVEPDLLPL